MFFSALLVCLLAFAASSPLTDTSRPGVVNSDINIPTTDDKADVKSYWAKKFKPTVTLSNTDGIQKSLDMPDNPYFSGIKINIKPYPGGYVSIKTDAGEIIKPILTTVDTDDSSVEGDDIYNYYPYTKRSVYDDVLNVNRPVTAADRLGYDPSVYWKLPLWKSIIDSQTTPTRQVPVGLNNVNAPVRDSLLGRVPVVRQDLLWPQDLSQSILTPEDIYTRIPRDTLTTDKSDKKDKKYKDTKEDEKDDEEKPLTLTQLNKYYWVVPKTEDEIALDTQLPLSQSDVYRPYGLAPWTPYGIQTRPTGFPLSPRITTNPLYQKTPWDTVNPWSRVWGGAYGSRVGGGIGGGVGSGVGIRQPIY